MVKSRNHIIPLMILWLFILSGCSNTVDILAPAKEIPVVYCILNQNDSTHFVRLERSFAGAENAYIMSQIADSIYYKDANVCIEEWKDNKLITSIPFNLVDTVKKDSGIFAYLTNPIYASAASLNENCSYKLNIKLPFSDVPVTAQTHLVKKIRIIKPLNTRPTLAFSAYKNYLQIEWISTTYARIYFIQLRFNYLEVIGLDTIPKSKIWNISHFVSEHDQGGETMEAQVLHENFYRWISAHFDIPQNGEKRIAHKKAIDIIFTAGGDELYTYMDLTDPGSGIVTERPFYSNISNGIGLFSARYEQELKGKALTFASIDSLSYGELTKGRGFVDSNDDYYTK